MTETKDDLTVIFESYADIFQRGPTPGVCATLEELEHFSAIVSAIPKNESEDELAAAHESMFGFNVFPFASVFLEPDGRLGQDITQAVRHFALSKGIDVDPLGDAPDHICSQLRILARLENDPASSARCIDEILLPWLPAFVAAVEGDCVDGESAFYSVLVHRLLEDIFKYRSALPDAPLGSSVDPCSITPSPHELRLEDSDTSVRDIAEYLTSPACCGMFLSRAVITRTAKLSRLPHGFGGRGQMMVTVFRSAAAYDALVAFAESLQETVEKNRIIWQKMLGADSSNTAREWAENWLARLGRTEKALTELSVATIEETSEEA